MAAIVALTGGHTAVAADAEAALEEILVTARKREESLQETPIAISAFTADALERQQIVSTEDLDQVTPNLQFAAYGPLTGNNSAAQVFIRGIGQTDGSSGVDPGVGLYIDEVYMGRAVGGAMDFRDIAGVQVLRGPQGTLFGRNTIGGAVLMTTTLPGDEYGGTMRVGFGEDNLWEVFAALDLPISDTLGIRTSGGARQRDGYVRRVYDGLDLGDEDTYTLQTSLRWEPSDAFNLTFRADYTKEDENGSPFVFAAINEAQVFPIFASVAAGCTNGATPPAPRFPPPTPIPQNLVDPRCANDASWNLGKYRNGGTAPASSSLDNWGVSAVVQFRVNDTLSFKSITAYRELEWVGQRDADNTPLTILHTDYASDGDQLSEELQALITAGPLKGVIGAFYFDESVLDLLQVPIAAGVAPATLAGSRDYQRAQLDNENWALFTQWTYDVTDALSLTAGVRYTEETKGAQIIGFTTAPVDAPTIIPTFLRPYITDGNGMIVQGNAIPAGQTSPGLHVRPDPFENDYSSTTGSASVQYRVSDTVMTYLSWSQGFKSGGFNQRFNSVTPNYVPLSFEEETAQTYELGVKTEFGGVLRLNAAVFNTDYDDMQLIYRVGVVPILFNAGKASIKGGELEFTYAPGALMIEGSLGYLDDSFDSITPIVVPGSPVTATVTPNNSLPFTPEWQGNVGIGYDVEVGIGTLTPRVNVSYTDSQFFDAANSAEVAQLDDVTLVNASLTWAVDAWKIRAGVNNVTDEEYRVAGNSSFSTSAGYAEAIYSRPRNWFVSAQFDF